MVLNQLGYDKDIGEYIHPDKNGEGEVILKAWYRQGDIFKSLRAYETNPDEVCYIPELSDTLYTANKILELCKGEQILADKIFTTLDWQHPETLLDDWFTNGEVDECDECGRYFLCYGETQCPHCGAAYKNEN